MFKPSSPVMENTRSALVAQTQSLLPFQRMFIGKTEDGFKFRTPKLRMRVVRPILPPGLNLQIPQDLTPEKFCKQIGGDCDEIHDKFENIKEVFELTSAQMKEKGVLCHQRRYILRCREMLRKGVLTFEYLNRRTSTDRCRA